jgi:hypothetical protein
MVAVEPAEEDGDRAGVVAELVAGADDDAQLGAPVGVAENPAVELGHGLVL